jgi:hypothetical protein
VPNDALRLWRAIESFPSLAAVETEWRQHLGEEFDQFRDYFRAAHRAREFPHPSGGIPYRVVEHGPDDIVGVCDETGDRITLSRPELVIYRFDIAKLRQAVHELLGLAGRSEKLNHPVGLHRVGEFSHAHGFAIPVYLVFTVEDDHLSRCVHAVMARRTGPFLLLTLTPRSLDTDARDRLHERKACLLALADLLAWNASGWVIQKAAQSRLQEFLRVGFQALGADADQAARAAHAPPAWIREHFRQQQYKLLMALWNQGDVPIEDLVKALSLTSSKHPEDAVRRRKTETNKGLALKCDAIGELWEISERRRAGVLHYFLNLCKGDRQK